MVAVTTETTEDDCARNNSGRMFRKEVMASRMMKLARVGLRRFMDTRGLTKDTEHEKWLGCTYEQLIVHLNKNGRGLVHGMPGVALHIDHIRPLSDFNLVCREELFEACNWSNLQLSHAAENTSKEVG